MSPEEKPGGRQPDDVVMGAITKTRSGPRRIVGVVAKVVLAALIIWGIYGCSSYFLGGGEFTFPFSVLGHKTSVIDGRAEFEVTMKLRGIDSGDTDMNLAAQDMDGIIKHVLKENGSEQGIIFHIVADGQDIYGHATQIQVFDIQYSMDDLKLVNWDNVTSNGLLNLSRLSAMSPAGADVGRLYCEKERDYAQVFCERF
jgi:hypothetical protein